MAECISWLTLCGGCMARNMTVTEQIAKYRELTSQERMAGYLATSAALAKLGCSLRLNKTDEEWTEAETLAWDEIGDESDPWWYSLTGEERKMIYSVDLFLAALTRGEMPDLDEIRKYTEEYNEQNDK